MITVDRYLHFDNIDMDQPSLPLECFPFQTFVRARRARFSFIRPLAPSIPLTTARKFAPSAHAGRG